MTGSNISQETPGPGVDVVSVVLAHPENTVTQVPIISSARDLNIIINSSSFIFDCMRIEILEWFFYVVNFQSPKIFKP